MSNGRKLWFGALSNARFRHPASRLCIAAAASLLYGCAHTLPGLNVEEGAPGVHSYGERNPGPDAALRKYEVVRVTPAVVAGLRERLVAQALARAPHLPVVSPADVPPEYRIGRGDVLFVTVWGHPELIEPGLPQIDNTLRPATGAAGPSSHSRISDRATSSNEAAGRLVAADGTMYYPHVGRFTVAGMTCAEASKYIAKHLSGVILDPKVDTRVVAYRAYRVQVTGEVKSPGTLTLDDTPKGVLQAIDASGGLTPEASRLRATLVRAGVSYQIDLASLLSGGAPTRNPLLEPGDELLVPNHAADKIFVLGEVERQQPILMQQATMPLIEALSTTGGLQRLHANDSGVLIFRRNEAQDELAAFIYALDMATPEGMLLASEFPLETRDVVYVKATAFAKYNAIIEQLLPTVETVFLIDRIGRDGVDRNGVRR